MTVFYTCDDGYVWLMGISVISLFENNRHIGKLDVYLLGEKISDANKEILLKIGERYGRKIEVIDVIGLDIPEILVTERWPLSAFTRLFAGDFLPQSVDRALYLDCDTIICGDISRLDQVNVENNIFCGIKDCISSVYKENIGLEKDDIYINAGVLLLNVNALRLMDVKSCLDQYINRYITRINYADQDILNGAFKDRIGLLEPNYNVMTIDVVHTYKEICIIRKPTAFYGKEELRRAVNSPNIIHYTTNMRIIRPWFSNTNHPMAAEFHKYMKISPWKDRKLSAMLFSSKESKWIGWIQQLPNGISCHILGMIHSYLKPYYIRLKAKRNEKN